MVSRHYRNYKRQQKGRSVHQEKRSRRENFRPAVFFVVVTLVLFLALDWVVRPSIRESMAYQAKSIASQLLAQKMIEVLENEDIAYSELSTIHRDGEGRITSIEANMNAVNRIKSELEQNVTQAVQELGVKSYPVPLGTILGSDFLTGRGPEIELCLVPSGYLKSEFVNVFQSAGINQTNHQIVLNLTLDLTTIVPLHRAQTTVSTNFIVAETVIVGEVPEYYTNIISSDKSLISDWNDHAIDQLDLER